MNQNSGKPVNIGSRSIWEVVVMRTLIDSRLIGTSIKNLRKSRNWTQEELADRVGYSVRNLRRIENEGTVNLDTVNTFADIFEVSAIDILDGVSFFLFYRYCI